MKSLSNKSFSTRAVHVGERVPRGVFRPVATPIWPSASYLYDCMDDLDAVFEGTEAGPIYLRYSNPTTEAFEAAVASLEEAESAQAYPSGMAAIHAALLGCGVRAGTAVVASIDLYSATFKLLDSLLTTLGVSIVTVNACDLGAVKAALEKAKPVCLFVESISNPLLKVADVPELAALAHQHGAALLVDNTFASPYLFTPLKHGADFVIHSATKYLSGHGDVLAGVVATSAENKVKLFELNKLVGGVLGPFEAWLALRGLKTLPLRVDQQCRNAMQVAAWLGTHPRVQRVIYPGLPDHPQHSLAEQLFEGRGYGGVVSFEIKDAGTPQVFKFIDALAICLPATTLGDIYSTVLHPATSTHRVLTPEERARAGIPEGLVRLSTGIESAEDLIADLEAGLASI